jgi:hypothetical protein
VRRRKHAEQGRAFVESLRAKATIEKYL